MDIIEDVDEAVIVAVAEAVEVITVDNTRTNPRRNPFWIFQNIWKRKFVYDSMAVVKVCVYCL